MSQCLGTYHRLGLPVAASDRAVNLHCGVEKGVIARYLRRSVHGHDR
jgi:hypothetical protein